MKVVILAGGYGTRLSEETDVRPKPMVEIGGRPILWHIMKIYSTFGFDEFVICLGYKGYMIKEYFAHYCLHRADFTIDLRNNITNFHDNATEPWKVTLVDTGDQTLTGGRVKRIQKYVDNEPFMLTYGDGVANIDLNGLLHFHRQQKKYVTVTAVHHPPRFGSIQLANDHSVQSFREKVQTEGSLINGGFFVMEPEIFDFIEGDLTILERDPLEKMAEINQLSAYLHGGFWQPMDTLRDKNNLEDLWNSGEAPWKIW